MISIRELAKHNGIKYKQTEPLSLAELVQESYSLYYDLQLHPDQRLRDLSEQLIRDIQSQPEQLAELTEQLQLLDQLAMLRELRYPKTSVSQRREARSRSYREASRMLEKTNWKEFQDELDNFIKFSKGKKFISGLQLFNDTVAKDEELTTEILIELHKALNSSLTHLAVELDKNPDFQETYSRVTALIQKDNLRLSNAIAHDTALDYNTLQDLLSFTNMILGRGTKAGADYDSNTLTEELNPELAEELDADMEQSEEDEELDDFEILPPDDIETEDDEYVIDITKQELTTILDVLERIALVAAPEEDELRADLGDMLGGGMRDAPRAPRSFDMGSRPSMMDRPSPIEEEPLEGDAAALEEPANTTDEEDQE